MDIAQALLERRHRRKGGDNTQRQSLSPDQQRLVQRQHIAESGSIPPAVLEVVPIVFQALGWLLAKR